MQQYIYIFKGDDTNWNGEQFLTVNITSQTADLSNMTAKFILGSYEKEYALTTGSFDIDLNAATTGSYAYGPICGTIQVIDEEGRIKTVANRIPFYITDQVIAEQVQTLDIAMPEGSEISLSLEVGKAAQITVDEELSTTSPNPVQNKVITEALEGKQNNLTAAQLNAANSGVTSSTVAQVGQNALAISEVEGKIPTQASAENQLADKNFVNSSINAVAAYYITSDVSGDPFATVAALDAGPYFSQGSLREPTRNDYALVTSDENHDGKTSRYLYDGSQWVWQYDLNNTTFTAAQVAAINSGVTSAKVAQIDTNASNITALQTASANNYTKTNLTAGTNISITPSQADPNVFEVNNTQDISGLTTDVTDLKANALKNTATGTNSLTVNGNATTSAFSINIGYNSNVFGATAVALGATSSASNDGAISIGYGASATPRYTIAIGSFAKANASGSGYGGGVAIGAYAEAKAKKAIAIGGYDSTSSTSDVPKATAESAIQLGQGTNNTAKTLQVYEYQLLDGNTGKIPAERLPVKYRFCTEGKCGIYKSVIPWLSTNQAFVFTFSFRTPPLKNFANGQAIVITGNTHYDIGFELVMDWEDASETKSRLGVGLTTANSSWNLGWSWSEYSLEPLTWYKVRLSYDLTKYTVEFSPDNSESWTTIKEATSSDKLYCNSDIFLTQQGNNSTNAIWKYGEVDINSFKATSGNTTYIDGVYSLRNLITLPTNSYQVKEYYEIG